MNVIIPVAGIGKRLRPHTYSTPKALLMTGGKPILAHILDHTIETVQDIHRVVFIVGYMGEKIKEYVSENYDFQASYIEQKEQLGLGHAIWLTRELAKSEPCLIVYGDTVFEADIPCDTKIDGYIGVKEVEDPRRFGIVEIKDGFVRKLIEKPAHPSTNLAIVGVNFISNANLLFDCLRSLIEKETRTAGEFQLTDAMELMIEKGAKFKTFPVTGWFDCGTYDTMLLTNRELLTSQNSKVKTQKYEGSMIKGPVFIHSSANIESSEIGPYVSIDKGANIKGSVISDSIINQSARIENSHLWDSIIGAGAVAKGVRGKLNIGDLSEVNVIKK
ncbi:nucleotidyl transferase [candidate division WOR-3 bacterium]|nr:nucleotidyl transferase [candidate division WOR-3 bacterium]